MFSPTTLLTTLLLSLYVAANPVVVRDNFVRLPFNKRVNLKDGAIKDLLKRDQARAAGLRARVEAKNDPDNLAARAAAASTPVTNELVSYIAAVTVGTDKTPFDLIVDTGSSNTWVGAGAKPSSSTSKSTGLAVSVEYGSGSFSGTEFTDTVSLGSGLSISAQSYGVASTSEGFEGVDGIVGIGPTDLTLDTLTRQPNTQIPTVTDNLFSQGTIPEHLVAVSFEPTNSEEITNGELTFGGTDSSKFTGSITFVPITSTSPANEFWGIDQSITYGTAKTAILSSTAGIVDTGTTLVLIASDAFSRYLKATGGVNDANTGLVRLTTAQFGKLQSLNFNIGSTTFELTANAQAFPRNLNSAIGGVSGSVYLIVNSVGTPTGEGLDFINGQTFLERFYSVFDTANKRVGLATTSFTTATTN